MTLQIPEMVKGSKVNPNSFHMKNGLNRRTEFTTTSHYGKTVMVCPYYTPSEKIQKVLMMERTGMCRSYIKKVL